MSHGYRHPLLEVTRSPTDEQQELTTDNDNRVGRRVLVVDDNEDLTELLSFMIESLGHEVCAVNGGDEALAVAPTFQPDIVILDVAMPGLDGFEVAQRLRAIPSCAGTLLVALTGRADPDLQARTTAAGFDHCYIKPVTVAQIRDVLRLPVRN